MSVFSKCQRGGQLAAESCLTWPNRAGVHSTSATSVSQIHLHRSCIHQDHILHSTSLHSNGRLCIRMKACLPAYRTVLRSRKQICHITSYFRHYSVDINPRKLKTRSQDSHIADENMSPQPQTLRILMLHGFTQSGPLFEIKTKALKKSLDKAFPAAPKPGHLKSYPGGLEFVYPTAPMKLSYTDIPGGVAEPEDLRDEAYGWWKRKGDSEPYLYDGLEEGLEAIAQILREEGPFDGVIGFSQGGSAAGMLAALLEPGRREAFEALEAKGGMSFPKSFVGQEGADSVVHPQMKFTVSYSGFGASRHPMYRAFYEPKITTPMQHFIGSVDTVVSEERAMQLVDSCVEGKGRDGGVSRVVFHPGGHFLPTQKASIAPLIAFIREIAEGNAATANGSAKKEESVEDMDVPF